MTSPPTYIDYVYRIQTQEPQGQVSHDSVRWRQGAQTPVWVTSVWGTAVVHRGTVYVSRDQRVFAFSVSEDKWTEMEPFQYKHSCMAVVCDKLTAIGGNDDEGGVTNSLLSLSESASETKWEELLPSMSTKRVRAAAVTTPNHLVVAGGLSSGHIVSDGLRAVEILDLDSLQWSSASSSPKAVQYPHMSLCGEHLYLLDSEDNTIFSCSVKELLKSCKPASSNSNDSSSVWKKLFHSRTNSSDSGSVWTKLADTPVPYSASLTTLRGQVLAIGGSDKSWAPSGTPTGAIHRYDRSTKSWSVFGEMPTPRCSVLVAVLPSHKLITVGGLQGGWACSVTEIASTD